MSQPYVGEIRMFAGNFPPNGWMFCEGQLLAISENDTLFNLIGTTFGGDGQQTFALPDLRGRLPIHNGTNPNGGSTFQLGEAAGVEQVTISAQQTPIHNHAFLASTTPGAQNSPANQLIAASPSIKLFIQDTPDSTLNNANSVTPVGGSQPHTNFQPYLCIDFIISLFGIFPHP
jgi:microcystin-dependent protein